MHARLKSTKFEATIQSNIIRPFLFFLGMSPAKLPFITDPTAFSVDMYHSWFMRDPLNLDIYRVVQVKYYKDMGLESQHEKIIAQITTADCHVHGYLCFERMRGSDRTEPTPKRPSLGPSSVSSFSSSSDSVKMKANAEDTVQQVTGFPVINSKKKNTIQLVETLKPRHNLLLSDLVVLTHTIHEHSSTYILVKEQCYWFANMIMCVLQRAYGHDGVMDNEGRVAGGRWHGITVYKPTDDTLNDITSQFYSNLNLFKARVEEVELCQDQAEEDRLAREQGRVAKVLRARNRARSIGSP